MSEVGPPDDGSDLVAARAAIMRNQPGTPRCFTTCDPLPRLTVGFGFDLERPGAPARIEALGQDFELLRSGRGELSEHEMHELLDQELEAAIEHVRSRLAGFEELTADRRVALVEMVMWIGPELFDGMCAAAEQRGSPPTQSPGASEWFDRTGPTPYLAVRRRRAPARAGRSAAVVSEVRDGGLGRWAQRLAQSTGKARLRYEAASGRSFLYLPDVVQNLLIRVERDWGDQAAAFWRAVAAHQWPDAVGALRALEDRRAEQAAALLERAIEDDQLPAPADDGWRVLAPRLAGGGVIVVAKPFGRLGNRLILFSHLIGAALEHGLTIVNPAFGEYADAFPALSGDPLCRFPPQQGMWSSPEMRASLQEAARAWHRALYKRQRSGEDVGLIRIEIEEGVDLNGEPFLDVVRRHGVVVIDGWYFRNADNCARHRAAIRSFFTPQAAVLEHANARVDEARRPGRPVVGVHVRRGDYARYKGGRYYYSHLAYRRIMECLASGPGGSGVTFFVSSDEPVPDDAFTGLPVTTGSGVLVEDLFALSACDFLIGPPSTFSRWASFYGAVPAYWIDDPETVPSYYQFSPDRGLGWGAARVRWAGPGPARASRARV